MNGNKLAGVPNGTSPINPESCAPTTLKYLKAIPFN